MAKQKVVDIYVDSGPNMAPEKEKVKKKSSPEKKIFHTFARETTLQGFFEISKYWNCLPLRIFFIITQIACYAVMVYHMYLVISQFMASPTLIQTVTTSQKTYKQPSLTFCPQLWLNVTRYNEIGIPKPAFLYAMSLMKRVVINEPFDVAMGKKLLKKFMAENNISTYYEFYTSMSNDFTNDSIFCRECDSWPPKKVVKEDGVCYFFTFRDWKPHIVKISQPEFAYNPINYPNDSIYDSFQTVGFSESVSIGSHENDFLAVDPIFMVPNHSFFLRVTPTKHTSINDKFTPCVEKPENISSLMCKAMCRQDARDRLCHLPRILGYFSGSNTVGPDQPDTDLWTSLNQSVLDYFNLVEDCHDKIEGELAKCDDKLCPPWCEEVTYATSIQTIAERRILKEMPEAAVTIVLSYQVRSGIVEVVEMFSYTWYSFLSDVGGLVGLWCGASVMSIMPIFIFFANEFALLFKSKAKQKKKMEKKKNQANGNVNRKPVSDIQTMQKQGGDVKTKADTSNV